ncbi:hypothetical protein IFR04_006742 [Cadophora malorum]|uniref:Uncharacterized protein n=1 Tax=Cadophora malorum TaxID=108018 RepID=A0A8H7TJS6_9HELO|nr:hypothetical protein IFR04_006742 [Cadophora malorum]
MSNNSLLAISTFIVLIKQGTTPAFDSYESGFTSNFVTPTKMPLERIRFTGSPNFYRNGTPWRKPTDTTVKWPENIKLFGEPSAEIDHNWERLIERRLKDDMSV